MESLSADCWRRLAYGEFVCGLLVKTSLWRVYLRTVGED